MGQQSVYVSQQHTLTSSSRSKNVWDSFSVTWGERTIISEATQYLISTSYEDEAFTIPNYLCSEHKLMKLMSNHLLNSLNEFGVFSVCRPKYATKDNPSTLLSLTTNGSHLGCSHDYNVGLHEPKLVRLR